MSDTTTLSHEDYCKIDTAIDDIESGLKHGRAALLTALAHLSPESWQTATALTGVAGALFMIDGNMTRARETLRQAGKADAKPAKQQPLSCFVDRSGSLKKRRNRKAARHG